MKLKSLDPLAPQIDLELEVNRVSKEIRELSEIAPPIAEEESRSALRSEASKEDVLQATSRRIEEFLRFSPKINPHLTPFSKLGRAIKAYSQFDLSEPCAGKKGHFIHKKSA